MPSHALRTSLPIVIPPTFDAGGVLPFLDSGFVIRVEHSQSLEPLSILYSLRDFDSANVLLWVKMVVMFIATIRLTGFMESRAAASVRLDVEDPDHAAPLLGFLSDELAEGRGRAGKNRAAQVGERRLHLGITESSVDLLVELVDDLDRCGLGRADAEPRARLVARHKLAHGRDVRQCVRAGRGGYRERAQPASLDILN